jgi:pimeloyl-ACP methyl ester carboxylesterase
MSKEPLVFLPGTLCTDATFEAQHRHLADVADCLTLPLSTGSTMNEMAAWVLEQSPRQFALVGFSQGAIVALEIMRQAPERVTRLCLIACNPRGSTQGQLDTWVSWQQEALAGNLPKLAEAFANNVHPDRRDDAGLRQRILDMAQETPTEVFIRQLQALASRVDSRPYLAQIFCPTLLIVGRQDPLTPLKFHQEFQEHLPASMLIPIEDCGHYVPLEQPQALSALLRYWLI